MIFRYLFIVITSLVIMNIAIAEDSVDTRNTILAMEKACKKNINSKAKVLKALNVECRPYVNHGGQNNPKALDASALNSQQKKLLATVQALATATKESDVETVSNLLADDVVIIETGGNAWNKNTYMQRAFEHLVLMFNDLEYDIIPLRVHANKDSGVVIYEYRLGGLHMDKPATTFGLGTATLSMQNKQWKINHLHYSGIQVY